MENPLLLYKNDTNDSFIRFDLIKDEHFEPAFEVTLAEAKENLKKIIENPEPPTFENTIEALEYVSEGFDRVTSIFFCLKEAHTNSVLDALAEKISPLIADFGNDISFSKQLFERVKKVYESNPSLETKEKERLLEKGYKGFLRNGALLCDGDKDILRGYDKELALLTQAFGKNLLAATNDFELHIIKEEDLSGIPSSIRDMAAMESKERGKKGWVFTLKAPSMGPFLQYADNAELRKDIYLASNTRGTKPPFDNRDIVLQIVRLRKHMATILGYPSYAHFVLDDRMAKTPETVESFFATLHGAVRPLAEKDFELLRAFKERKSGEKELYPWDIAYYEEKMKKEHFDFDEELLRPYLEVRSVIEGVFAHARLLYGLSCIERTDIPVYHPDVKAYEVRTNEGIYLGLVYFDLFPRKSKRGGAWANDLRVQRKKEGIDIRPNILITANLTKPTETTPALLTSHETKMIFHEFGHALHVLFSECQYASLSGYNVLWDFCELPSQLMDSWLQEKESFALFATHYQTGEPLPAELLESSLRADRFMSAWMMLSQLGAAALDMAWHTPTADSITDIEQFENDVRAPYRLFERQVPGTSTSTSFGHVFDGGYAAGYYSYHWAEVLAADAFEYFKENGLFSQEIAEKFRANVLSKGNTEEPLELYRAFRGRDADPAALLRHKGLA